jgi:hypothetical protein
MAYCLIMDEEKASENSKDEEAWNKYSMIFQMMEQLETSLKLLKRKKSKEEEEEQLEEYYNVCVYRILPYPPNTKQTKDFFVQRT